MHDGYIRKKNATVVAIVFACITIIASLCIYTAMAYAAESLNDAVVLTLGETADISDLNEDDAQIEVMHVGVDKSEPDYRLQELTLELEFVEVGNVFSIDNYVKEFEGYRFTQAVLWLETHRAMFYYVRENDVAAQSEESINEFVQLFETDVIPAAAGEPNVSVNDETEPVEVGVDTVIDDSTKPIVDDEGAENAMDNAFSTDDTLAELDYLEENGLLTHDEVDAARKEVARDSEDVTNAEPVVIDYVIVLIAIVLTAVTAAAVGVLMAIRRPRNLTHGTVDDTSDGS